MKLSSFFKTATQWVSDTPERALEKAYRTALKIQAVENKYFNGKPAFPENSLLGESNTSTLIADVNSYLKAINMRLMVFKTSRQFFNLYDPENESSQQSAAASVILEKLQFIDQVISRYQILSDNSSSIIPRSSNYQSIQDSDTLPVQKVGKSSSKNNEKNLETASQKTGALPRSFLKTLNKLKQEIDPKSGDTEEEVVNKYRKSRYKTAISVKFILFLIIVPLLTHQLSKTFILNPLVQKYFENHEQIVFINQDLEEEAFQELKHFEEHLRFQGLIGLKPKLSETEIEEKMVDEAEEITERFRQKGRDAFANVFADLFSLGAFAGVIAMNRQEIEIVKGFLDEILYSLSDSAKAFLIILFTDMFVGFHSPHGWEVILEGIAHHFGLPENREFNFLFIATFPVILDTVLKYWIFRYLNRISPSAVATYKNMNE
ncbi:MAG: proton extrusion protein PcxA [Microcystaceae cyanobacterium]